jgi:hypothetical protein
MKQPCLALLTCCWVLVVLASTSASAQTADAPRGTERAEATPPPAKTEPRVRVRSSHTVDVIAPGEKVDTVLGRMRLDHSSTAERPGDGPGSGSLRGPDRQRGPGRGGLPGRPGDGARPPPHDGSRDGQRDGSRDGPRDGPRQDGAPLPPPQR